MLVIYRAVLIVMLSASLSFAAEVITPDSHICQETVDAFEELIRPYLSPPGVINDDQIDVGAFFTVLDLLRMEEGYELDFLYETVAGGGYPVLIARPSEVSIDEFAERFEEIFSEEERESGTFRDKYLEYVRTDGSADAFFQLSILRLMGFHFYLSWHSLEFDDMIVCEMEGVDALSSRLGAEGIAIDRVAYETVKGISLVPVVEMDTETVEVSFIAFTKYGGFERHVMTFSREFPHALISYDTETVAFCFVGGIH